MKRGLFFLGAVCVLALPAAAQQAEAEARSAAAFARLAGPKLSGDEARARVRELLAALEGAGFPRSAVVLLAQLTGDEQQSPDVRAAARAELVGRAERDLADAQLLFARDDGTSTPPPELALSLARGHLERALQLAPPVEGVAFESKKLGPATAPPVAQAVPQPLDKDLAAEMGAPAQEPVPDAVAPPAPPDPEPHQRAVRELERARALAASVPKGDRRQEADAHELLGLTALAAGDERAAEREFLALSEIYVPRGDDAAAARRDKAYLQLARLAYQSGDDARATELYSRVGRGAPEWLDGLFEASWAHFRRSEDERALGNLLTLHAPFFQGRFFPESYVLKALVFYENCRYADARLALSEFGRRYQALHDGLADLSGRLPSAQAGYELLARGAAGASQVQPGAREEVLGLEQEPDLASAVKAVNELGQELDTVDQRSPAFRSSPLAARLAPASRQARLDLIQAAGRRMLARIDSERGELRELLGQSLRLDYEIAGREKELLQNPQPELLAQPHRDPPQVEDDEVLWPFQGEYWRDELGSYRFQLGKRCLRRRAEAAAPGPSPAVPEPQAAEKPADAAPH